MTRPVHRKRVKHFHEPGSVHELTFSCYQRRPLLTNAAWCQWFCESLDRACARHRFGLLAYVVMPEHVHLLVVPREPVPDLPRLLSDTKRGTAAKVKQVLTARQSPLLQQLTIRQRPNVTTFRLWQEGPGYDRNLNTASAILAAIDYIHENPVRRGLCRRAVEYRWSSARRLLLDGQLDEVPRLCRFDPAMMMVI